MIICCELIEREVDLSKAEHCLSDELGGGGDLVTGGIAGFGYDFTGCLFCNFLPISVYV
jgi:hypothetical protein